MNKAKIKQEPNNKFHLFGHFCLSFYNFVCVCLCVCVLSHFSHVWLWDPMDCSLPCSSVYGILQARTVEWVAISSLFIFNQINAFSKQVKYLTQGELYIGIIVSPIQYAKIYPKWWISLISYIYGHWQFASESLDIITCFGEDSSEDSSNMSTAIFLPPKMFL